MKKFNLQNLNSVRQPASRNNYDSSIRLIGRSLGLLVFGLLLTTMANVAVLGQMADAFNPSVNEAVFAIEMQPDGKILIGGNFTSVGGQMRNRVARINADGTLDTTFVDVQLGQPVYALAVQPDGKIIIGTIANSLPTTFTNRLFRVNADGTPDTTFSPDVNRGIYGIALQNDGKVIIGGYFNSVNGTALSNLARLNSDGTLDTSFTQIPDSTVSAVVRQPDGKILIGGIFNSVNGMFRNRIFRLNADGTLDNSFNSMPVLYGSSRGILDIALQVDGKIIIGGHATSDGTIKTVARLNADGTPDTAFNQNVEPIDGEIRAVAVQSNGKIVIGGITLNTVVKPSRLNADGTRDFAFNPNPDLSVYALAVQPDQKILVGGFFTKIGGANRSNFARLLSDSPSIPATEFDFDGDSKADIAAFRPSNGSWYIYQSAGGLRTVQFGFASDRLAPADYDGDFKTDIAVFREGSQAYFYMLQSQTNTFRAEAFGTTGDVPTVGDWDGDNKADVAVYRNGSTAEAQSYFYYRPTATAGVDFRQFAWGTSGDKPVVGDFDGDGKQDAVVFRPSSGIWYVSRSSDNQLQVVHFGIASDKLVAADYDGDNKTDIAVYRGGTWYLQRSQLGFTAISFGAETDVPTPADYDGDGKTDLGVFRNGIWYLNRSTSGFTGGAYSAAGDKPIPNAFVP